MYDHWPMTKAKDRKELDRLSHCSGFLYISNYNYKILDIRTAPGSRKISLNLTHHIDIIDISCWCKCQKYIGDQTWTMRWLRWHKTSNCEFIKVKLGNLDKNWQLRLDFWKNFGFLSSKFLMGFNVRQKCLEERRASMGSNGGKKASMCSVL